MLTKITKVPGKFQKNIQKKIYRKRLKNGEHSEHGEHGEPTI